MRITEQLLTNELLNETLSLSKLMILRCRIFEIKLQMHDQKKAVASSNDDQVITNVNVEYEYVLENLKRVDAAIHTRHEDIHEMGQYHNNCLN